MQTQELVQTKIADGQPAGDPRYELLRDPRSDLVRDVQLFADPLFIQGPERRGLLNSLPHFGLGIDKARVAAWGGQFRRNEMPVIQEEDLEDLKAALTRENIKEFCEECRVLPGELSPMQRQIYVDKAVSGTAKNGVAATRLFLMRNHLIIDRDNNLIDGHHRWLTACTLDLAMPLPAFRIKAPLQMMLKTLLAFSDARHRRNQ